MFIYNSIIFFQHFEGNVAKENQRKFMNDLIISTYMLWNELHERPPKVLQGSVATSASINKRQSTQYFG